MPERKPMQDVIPPTDRSIRNIPIPTGRRTRGVPPLEEPPMDARPPRGPRESRGFSRFAMWGAAIVALSLLFFLGFSVLFAGATVVVEPTHQVATINGEFSASPDAPVTGLSYQLVTIERDGSEVVEAGGEQYVERRAAGKIVISNNYSTSVQRLIKNTRFEAPDGKIYRINESVDVPGQRRINGELVPGTIEVMVYADSPGESYNRGLTDFTIPGFKGDPRYSKFTARSTTPMAGGFVGNSRVVSEAERTAARERIHARLSAELEEAARAQVPAGFVLFPEAFVVSFDSAGEEAEGDDSVRITERGILHGVLFGSRELAAFIARQSLAAYVEESVGIPDVSGLSFTMKEREKLRFPLERPLLFTLSGTANIVWQIDDVRLKSDLLGREKDALPTIMAAYPVSSFRISTRPFWSSTLTDDPARLKLVVTVPESGTASSE
jgi:uncharacterized protein YbjT (DUF2867 family)